MILSLRGSINEEMLDKVINAYNNISEKERLTIYLNSTGGNVSISDTITNIINQNSTKTFLIAYGTIYSSAFKLFFEADCPKSLAPTCIGMFHQSTMPIVMNENFKPSFAEDHCFNKLLTNFCKPETIRFCEYLEFTAKELQKIKRDEDVYFLPDRLQEFLSINLKSLVQDKTEELPLPDLVLLKEVSTCYKCLAHIPCPVHDKI
jgi:hypothetical protein